MKARQTELQVITEHHDQDEEEEEKFNLNDRGPQEDYDHFTQ